MDSTQVLINSLMSANSVDELKSRLIPLLTAVAQEGPSGSGITSILSDTLTVTEDGGVARVELPYEGIPLTGTEEDKPLTGTIKVEEAVKLAEWTIGDEVYSIGFVEGSFMFTVVNTVSGAFNRLSLDTAGVSSSLAIGDGTTGALFSLGITSGTRKALILSDELGFFDKAELGPPSAQAAAIADATDATDVITQLNTLLAAMRAYGLIAE
jgi:hypothetical protein